MLSCRKESMTNHCSSTNNTSISLESTKQQAALTLSSEHTVSSSWTRYSKKSVEILHWAPPPPVCLTYHHIISPCTLLYFYFPGLSHWCLHTVSDQNLDSGEGLVTRLLALLNTNKLTYLHYDIIWTPLKLVPLRTNFLKYMDWLWKICFYCRPATRKKISDY